MAVLNIVSFAGLLLFIQGCARAEVVTVSAGDTAVLSCTRSSDINITFWSGPPGFSTYNYPGSTTINEDLLNADRLEINGTSAELLIHNVKLSDEGSYKCSATSIGTAELQLVVTNISPYATVIHGIHDEKNKSVIWGTEDQNITLSCSAYGAKPKPYITWAVAERNTTFNSTVDTVEHANGTFDVTIFYTFVADRLYDNVVFKCSIDHPTLQTPLEKAAVINLYLKPIFDSTQEQTIVSEQFDETVSCQVSGSRPRANISLYFDGEELTGHKDNIVTYNESSDTFDTTALFRSKMDREDNGKPILCVVAHMALNANINRTWLIDVQFPPSIEVSGENVSLVSETVSLNCNVISGNPDNYTFSRWQHRWPAKSGNILREIESTSVEHNEAILMLENATFQDSGYYKCLVSNGIETPANKDYKAEKDMFVLIKDVPVVTDGRTEYRSSTDEKIKVDLDVYTNVEPVHASIATKNTDVLETTAVWTIKENTRMTVWISVYGHSILVPGFRISADFEVQAEENYGDYTIAVRNAIGSTMHDFKVLPRVDATKDGQTEKDDGTNVVGIAVGVPIAFLVVVAAVAIGLYMWRKKSPQFQTDSAPEPGRRRFQTKAPGSGGKRFIPTEPGEYDYINPPPGWPRPPHGHRDTTSDSGYLHPKPTMMAERVIEQPDGTKITTRVQAHGVTPMDVPTYTAMLSLTSGEMPATKDGYVTMTGNEGAKDGYITMERKEGTTEARKVDPAAESGPIIEEMV